MPDSAVFKASTELVNVPNAETWASSAVDCELISFCWPAPKALVRDETIAEMSRPEPIPVDVMSELTDDAAEAADEDDDVDPDVVVGVVEEVLEMLELMSLYVLSQAALLIGCGNLKLKQGAYQKFECP
jgi:hypothetical protein